MALSRSFTPNLVIKNLDGDPIAVIETQSRTNMSRDIAIGIRRNMLETGLPAHIPFFLLLSQDVGYLWKDAKPNEPNEPPISEFSMRNVIKRYSIKNPEQRLYGYELKLVVYHWLINLSKSSQKNIEEPEKTLALFGFDDVIRGALVLIEEKL
ncbi:MAG: hypothetical protein NVS4B11_08460 [Ktedonobacteraceae bacterium]